MTQVRDRPEIEEEFFDFPADLGVAEDRLVVAYRANDVDGTSAALAELVAKWEVRP